MKDNPELNLAYQFIQFTNRNIFLTGKAGTGKTTFLKSLKLKTHKRIVVIAPTGVAAINAGGVTIHSFFQFPFGPILTKKVAGHQIENTQFKQQFNREKINIIKSMDLLVIDEISMVRADMLDAIDETLRKYKDRYHPFGGVQLLMIGDLQQLSPVVKKDEWHLLRSYYKSMYFFNSKAIEEAQLLSIELQHVYRQKDDQFLEILNGIRKNKLSQESYKLLNERYNPNFNPKDDAGYITLTTHNNSANKINDNYLRVLKGKSSFFKATVNGKFSEYSYPTDYKLELKIGAQVMFVKNDSSYEKRYYNGKIGKIVAFEADNIVVKCPDESEPIYVNEEVWENIKFNINPKTKAIEEEQIGAFTQFPLRLAWAITIHKSQGLTFEKAIIDAAAAFSHGQTYVALSRCKTLEGLVLSSKIAENAIICDVEIDDFNAHSEEKQPDEAQLLASKYKYQLELITSLFNYKPLHYTFNQLKRNLDEHGNSVHGNLNEHLTTIQKNHLPELTGIAGKFTKQVVKILDENPNAEDNPILQERVKKAANYFNEYQHNNMLELLKNSSFESDNKAALKAINKSLETINTQLNIKQQCYKSCTHGFNLTNFLDVRAKASIIDSIKTPKTKISYKEIETKHQDLYSLLKYWRKDEASSREVRHYQIASQKALLGIANELPVTSNQLMKIHGIGKKKLEEFGEVIIEMVKEYIVEKGISPNEDEPAIIKVEKKKNHETSYELYLTGKTVEEIAKECGFVVSTVENHLSRYVASGDLQIYQFVEKNMVELILKQLNKKPNANVSDIKNALPEHITYAHIRFVQKHMEFVSKKNA